MTNRKAQKAEKIRKHCIALAEMVVAIRGIYENAEPQQKAFIETMIGAAIWYIPKPENAWTGYMSSAALKSFHPRTGSINPKISEEHVYPRKIAARLLLEDKSLDGRRMLELFQEKYGRLHYVTPDENKAVTRFQKDVIFTEPERAYLLANIELISIDRDDIKNILRRDAEAIEKYLEKRH